MEAAHSWWVDQGWPDADRWRFTVTPQAQRIKLVSRRRGLIGHSHTRVKG